MIAIKNLHGGNRVTAVEYPLSGIDLDRFHLSKDGFVYDPYPVDGEDGSGLVLLNPVYGKSENISWIKTYNTKTLNFYDYVDSLKDWLFDGKNPHECRKLLFKAHALESFVKVGEDEFIPSGLSPFVYFIKSDGSLWSGVLGDCDPCLLSKACDIIWVD